MLARPVFVNLRFSSYSNILSSSKPPIVESFVSADNSSAKIPEKGEEDTIAYFNVPPLIGVPS